MVLPFYWYIPDNIDELKNTFFSLKKRPALERAAQYTVGLRCSICFKASRVKYKVWVVGDGKVKRAESFEDYKKKVISQLNKSG